MRFCRHPTTSCSSTWMLCYMCDILVVLAPTSSLPSSPNPPLPQPPADGCQKGVRCDAASLIWLLCRRSWSTVVHMYPYTCQRIYICALECVCRGSASGVKMAASKQEAGASRSDAACKDAATCHILHAMRQSLSTAADPRNGISKKPETCRITARKSVTTCVLPHQDLAGRKHYPDVVIMSLITKHNVNKRRTAL